MSKGVPCRNQAHRSAWRVSVRRGNFSTFNGGRWTPSEYSEVICTIDGQVWRTKAAYVAETPDLTGSA